MRIDLITDAIFDWDGDRGILEDDEVEGLASFIEAALPPEDEDDREVAAFARGLSAGLQETDYEED